MFKRFLEFHVLRSETVYVPPHLRNLAICSVMESHGRERRLRAFGISAFREMLQAQGQAVDDSVNPPEPPESGHWGDQRFRRFYTSQDQFNRYLDTHHYGYADPADPDGLKMLGRPRKAFAASRRLQPQAKHLAGEKKRLADFPGGGTHANVDATLTPMKKKGRRYPNDVQHRGRPRKYIQVVELDGRINRNIIGSVHATPELPSCLIYVKAKNILVDAPPGYPGVGVPPPLSAEDVKKGKPPKYYSKFPKLKPPIKSRGDRSGKKRKKRKHGDETTETISKPSKRIKKEKILRDEDPGEREQMDADIQIEAEVDELDSDDGVGEAGPGPSTIKNQLGAREDSTDEAAQEKAYVDQAILPVASITEPATQAGEMEKTPILDRKKKRTSRKSEGHSTAHDSAADAELITFPPDALESGTHQAELVDPAARLQDRGSSDIRSTLAESSTANQKQMRTSRKKGKATETIGMDAATASTEKAAYLSTFADEVPVRSTGGKKRKSSPEPLQSIPPSAVEATDPLTTTAAPSTPDGILGTKGLRKRKSTAFTDGAHPDSTSPSTQAITLTPTGKKRGRPRKTPAARSFPSPVIGERLLSDYSIPEPPDDVPIQTEFELPETLARVIAKGAERNLDELERSEPHHEMEKAQDLRQSGETRDIAVPPSGAPKYAKLASRRRLPPLINAHIAGNITVDHLPASGTPGQNVALSTPPSPPPAQPPQQIQSNATRKSGWVMEGTPINEIDPKAEAPARATSHGPSKARPDFSFVRRANEICQALKEAGGVLTDHKLLQEHRDWAVRVARTSAPFAPAIAAGMDRQVFKRAIRTIVYQGRLKETIATIPTTTGRWQKAGVLYIPEIGQADVQAYIRKLSDMTQQAFAPKRVPRTKIAATQFTEIRLPCGRPSLTRVQATPQQAATAATGVELSGAERRATLLKDPNTISYLYGFKSGRNLRLETLHRAMVHAMADGQQSESLVSTLPRIFALPFLLEDITVADWFACFFTTWYDEALEQFLADPETRMTKLRDIPRHIRPPGGFNGNGAKSKLFSMLAAMTDLKLVTPLVAVGDAEATLSTPRRGGFQPSGSSSLAAHYLVHEVAPVYHIAADEAALLGTLPVKTPAEIDKYWAIMKDACLETNINRLPILDNSHGSEAPLKPTFEGSLESHKLLQSLQRWRHCIRLLPVQRAVLDEAVDKRTGMRLISVEEMDRIAYEYALPRNAVQEQIDRRVGFFRDREAQREQRAQQDNHKAKDRHERAERTLREKIAERHAQTKQAWEERIRVSAERLGIAFGPALIDLVSRQTLSTTQRAESAEMTEKKLDEIVRLFERNRLIGSGPSPGQIQPAPRKARLAPRTRKEKRAKARGEPDCVSSIPLTSPKMQTSPWYAAGGIGRKRTKTYS